MKAFLEPLCEHAGIVRAGPKAEKYGDPYEGSAAYLIEGNNAVIKGLAVNGLTMAHARAAFRAFADAGLKPTWERIK